MTRAELNALVWLLCDKVAEVVSNNDWPTTEGQCTEDRMSTIEMLVDDIRMGIKETP